MQIEVTTRHFKAPDELKNYVEKEVQKLERYFDGMLTCRIVLTRDEGQTIAEIIAHAKRHQFTVIEASPKVDRAVATAVTKLKTQVKRYKDRLIEK